MSPRPLRHFRPAAPTPPSAKLVRIDRTVEGDAARSAALEDQIGQLRQALAAIRAGGIDAVVNGDPGFEQVFPLDPTDLPYRKLIEEMSDGAATVSKDGLIISANRRLAEIVGGDQEELLGKRIKELVHPSSRADFEALLRIGVGQRGWAEVDLLGAGHAVHVALSSSCVEIGPVAVHCLIASDLTARVSADEEIRQLNRQLSLDAEVLDLIARDVALASILEHLVRGVESEGVGGRCEVVIQTGGRFPVSLSVAPSISRSYVRQIGALRLGGVATPHGDAHHSSILVAVDRVGVNSTTGAQGFDTWPQWQALARAECLRAVWVVAISSASETLGTITCYPSEGRRPTTSEIQFLQLAARLAALAVERSDAAQRLKNAALHDDLTDLPNRVLFADRLDHALREGVRTGSQTAVYLLDLDGFKLVNDSMGHSVGDRLLRAVARRISAVIRPGDTLARFGGDEFVVIGPGLDGAHNGVRLGRRLLASLAKPFELEGVNRFVTASIGLAMSSGLDKSPEELIRDADAAMYRAKALGRNRLEIFDEYLRAKVLARLDLEAGLRLALDRGQLAMHYQPQVDLRSGTPFGIEALVRWNRPSFGLVAAATFIPVAEDSGLIVDIGGWVLRRACTDAVTLGEQYRPLALSVNLSTRQLHHPNIVEEVAGALRDSRLPPSRLCLEITETVLVDESTALRNTMHELSELGVRVSVDDFGTGYASLAYLKRMAVDELKVDMSFVTGLGRRPEDEAIVAAVTGLGNALNLDVVAEGVETRLQANRLLELGCNLAQGYLFQPAQPLSTLISWLADGDAAGWQAGGSGQTEAGEPVPDRVRRLSRKHEEVSVDRDETADAGWGETPKTTA
jgi:diguanylate cyclase (GGDEF)-like protein/PAS domain S-box-containing protein